MIDEEVDETDGKEQRPMEKEINGADSSFSGSFFSKDKREIRP